MQSVARQATGNHRQGGIPLRRDGQQAMSAKTGQAGNLNARADFPLFQEQPGVVYLDSAATALKPRCVIDAINNYYNKYSANVHRGFHDLSQVATDAYEGARKIVQRFLKAKSEKEIIFTRGATESLNVVAQGWGRQYLVSGDEVILSILDHHSNIVPWQMLAKEKGIILKFIDVDERGVLKIDQLSKLITRRTKMIALTHVSNALGTINPLRPLIQKAHAIRAKVLIDAAQSAPHLALDVQYLDCDFLVFSGHKVYGPTGIGVLYAKENILEEMEPFLGGGDMIIEVSTTHSKWNELPWKFEAGTPPIAQAIGLGRAIEYLEEIGFDKIRRHEKDLLTYALAKLQKIPGVRLHGPCDAEVQTSVISFTMDGVHPHDIASILNEEHVGVRAGHHCCMPLMERLKLPSTARASFGIYTNEDDVDKLEAAILKVKKVFA